MLNQLNRKLNGDKWPGFMFICIILYAVGYLITTVWPVSFVYICFDAEAILKGQVWRLFTFLMVPDGENFFMALITCFIYFSISNSLEMIIGRFKVNFFLVLGWLFLIVAGFAYYFIFKASGSAAFDVLLNPYYLYAMLFVLFATIFPDATFLFMFIIPIKGKWMTFITLGLYLVGVASAFFNGAFAYGWILVFMIVAAILALVVFLLMNGAKVNYNRTYQKPKQHPVMHAKSDKNYRHKCAICGRTDQTNPELEFRFCSKCIGPYEYCNEHLYTHVHKRPEG